MSLTDTQRAIRAAAAQHPEQLVSPPEQLPAGARQKMAQALLKQDLLIAVHRPAYDAIAKWTVGGEEMLLKITDDGLRAIGIDTNAGDAPEQDEQDAGAETPAQDAPTEPLDDLEPAAPVEDTVSPEAAQAAPRHAPRARLREAGAAVLAAWDNGANRTTDIIAALDGPMETRRALLAAKPARAVRESGAPRKPREGTRQEAVLTMLRRPEGATIAPIRKATAGRVTPSAGFSRA